MKKKVAVLLAASALSIPAYAADTGWYVVGSIGQTKFNDVNSIAPPINFDDSDTGFKLGGGYMFNKFVGVEGAYVDLGKATVKGPAGFSGDFKASGISVVALGVYPINPQWSVHGRLGFIDATVKIEGPGGSTSSTDVKTTFGVGGAFHLNKEWSVHLDYDIYSSLGDNSKTGESDVNMISLGVMYKF
jgi:OmpA-OmpF porin, OOP family